MNNNPEIEEQNREMTLDESILKNREDTLPKYIIESMKENINKCAEDIDENNKDYNTVKELLNLDDKNILKLYDNLQKTFQGHKSISGQTLEKPIEKKLREEDIPYVAQGKVSNEGRLMRGRVNGKELISMSNLNKNKLQKLAEHHGINIKKDNGKDKIMEELKKNILDKVSCLRGDNKNQNKGVCDIIIPLSTDPLYIGDKLDNCIIISAKTEVRERWKGEDYVDNWDTKIHIGLEPTSKHKKMKESGWISFQIGAEKVEENAESMIKFIKTKLQQK